jgi:hypothetical protein
MFGIGDALRSSGPVFSAGAVIQNQKVFSSSQPRSILRMDKARHTNLMCTGTRIERLPHYPFPSYSEGQSTQEYLRGLPRVSQS